MEYDIHTILDTATLAATLFVIYMIRFKLRSTYMLDKDNFKLYYVVRTNIRFLTAKLASRLLNIAVLVFCIFKMCTLLFYTALLDLDFSKGQLLGTS